MNSKEYQKEYREKNKEKLSQKRKEYVKKNSDKIKAYYKENDNVMRISDWKRQKMILREGEDWISIYIHYIITDECELCGNEFTCGKDKHLDHDHESGFIRDILCMKCNMNRE